MMSEGLSPSEHAHDIHRIDLLRSNTSTLTHSTDICGLPPFLYLTVGIVRDQLIPLLNSCSNMKAQVLEVYDVG